MTSPSAMPGVLDLSGIPVRLDPEMAPGTWRFEKNLFGAVVSIRTDAFATAEAQVAKENAAISAFAHQGCGR